MYSTKKKNFTSVHKCFIMLTYIHATISTTAVLYTYIKSKSRAHKFTFENSALENDFEVPIKSKCWAYKCSILASLFYIWK